MIDVTKELISKATYDNLSPISQGYVQYWQGAWPGSELRDEKNPYPEGSKQHIEWEQGQLRGALDAQDSEE